MSLTDIHCCLPETVEARLCGPGDRRAFSKRAIREGEVVLRNCPTAFALLEEHRPDRCSYCLSTLRRRQHSSNNDSSDAVSHQPKLFRCSRCQQVKYCSRDCQKLDFPYHKVECRESKLLFGSSENATNLGFDWNDARLLVRNFLAIRQNPEKCESIVGEPLPGTSCGSAHFQNLAMSQVSGGFEDLEQAHRAAKAIWNQRQAIHKSANSKIPFPKELSDLQVQLEGDLRRFRINNFGIADSMIRVCASGVFPLGALLNHSCAPNCLLRYSFRSGQQPSPPIMEIVAACDIDPGQELTHSYIELVACTKKRNAKLEAVYRFNCHCPRCDSSSKAASPFVFQLPSTYETMGPMELVRWVLRYYNPILEVDDSESVTTELQETILKPITENRGVTDANGYLENARQCLLNGSIEAELIALGKAVEVLELASKQSNVSPLHTLCSPELYKARGDRLSSLIVAGKLTDAVTECEHIVAFLCLALNHVRNHGLLGLQLFTLGDLYEANESLREAGLSFRWAKRILQVSHGMKDDITKLLFQKGH